MGLPRVQVLPSDMQYYSEQIMSPVTFFSTLDTTVNSESDTYDVIPLEELEIGMVTEVSTTPEDEDTTTDDLDIAAVDSAAMAEYSAAMADAAGSVHPNILPLTFDCEFTGSEIETETCDLENQTYENETETCDLENQTYENETETCDLENQTNSEDDGSYRADSLSESMPNTYSWQNNNKLGSISENCNENLDIVSENLNELVADICNDDVVFAWLSSLNENSATSRIDFELGLPAAEKNANDVGVAKEELRSFLLARKTKTNAVQEPQNSKTLRSHRSHHDDVTGTWNKAKLTNSDPEELIRHRRRQECNRIAARKCRQKRTKLAEELTNESEQLRKHNEQLTSEVRDLTRELRKLENFVLDHDLHMGSYQCQEQMSTLVFSQIIPELP